MKYFEPTYLILLSSREVFFLTDETNTNNTEVNARFSGIEERVN
jgi:hypothetical protein